jgi:elongation factor Ts
MADISAADVARLRRVTLAGMMDCKKALEEAEGDFNKAIEIIRKKGQAVANKRADREATEGVVLSKVSADG